MSNGNRSPAFAEDDKVNNKCQKFKLCLLIRDFEIGFGIGRQHAVEHFFDSHGVDAASPRRKEGTIASPFIVFKVHGMVIVDTVELNCKIVELHPLRLLGITKSFLHLINQT